MIKGNPNAQPHSIVAESCRYTRRIRGMLAYTKRRCLKFCIEAGFVEIEPAHTGSNASYEQIKVKRCFNAYFDRWDKPETTTVDSGKMYIWNITNKGQRKEK